MKLIFVSTCTLVAYLQLQNVFIDAFTASSVGNARNFGSVTTTCPKSHNRIMASTHIPAPSSSVHHYNGMYMSMNSKQRFGKKSPLALSPNNNDSTQDPKIQSRRNKITSLFNSVHSNINTNINTNVNPNTSTTGRTKNKSRNILSLSMVKNAFQSRNHNNNNNVIKKGPRTLSSMVLLANMLYDSNQNDQECNPLSMMKRRITHSKTHRSRLSDRATFEFERREHKEVFVNVDDDNNNSEYSGSITTLETITGIGSGETDMSSLFRKEHYEQEGVVTSYKKELDEINKNSLTLSWEEKYELKRANVIESNSKSKDAGDRAFAMLLELNLIKLNLDPDDPDYDHSVDDDFVMM